MERQRERERERETYIQTNRQTGILIDQKIEGQTDRRVCA